jgi:hypothetical protein
VYRKDPEKARLLEVKARLAQQYVADLIVRFHIEHGTEPDRAASLNGSAP